MDDAVRELERLGFRIVRRSDDGLVALRRKWHWDCGAVRLTTIVTLRTVDVLDAAAIEDDRRRFESEAKDLDRGGLPRGLQKGVAVLPLYLARTVDPSARALITARPPRRWAYFHVPSARDTTTGEVLVLESTPMWGAVFFPKFRHLARRVLDPASAPEREPTSMLGVVLVLLIVLMMLLCV